MKSCPAAKNKQLLPNGRCRSAPSEPVHEDELLADPEAPLQYLRLDAVQFGLLKVAGVIERPHADAHLLVGAHQEAHLGERPARRGGKPLEVRSVIPESLRPGDPMTVTWKLGAQGGKPEDLGPALAAMLLQFGADVEALEPPTLRDEVILRLKASVHA